MNKKRLRLCSLLAVVLFSSLFFSNIQPANADASTLDGILTITPSMTIEISNVSPTVAVVPTSSGTFASTSINVSAHSNGSIGYSLVMTPSSTNLTGSATSSTVPTLSSGSYTSANFPAGFWGISVDSNNYVPAATTTLFTTTSANTSVVNSSHTIGLAAKLDLTNPSDIYTNSINFSAVSIAVQSYPITFEFDENITSIAIKDSNGATKATVSTSGSSASLDYATPYTIVPTYEDGYGSNSIALSSGAGIIDQNNYSFITGSGAGTVTLTAKLLRVYMQDVSQSTLAALMPNTKDTAVLIDGRDETEYEIIKLPDGNYWMRDNLALDISNATVRSKMFDSEDTMTNAAYQSLVYLFNGGGSTASKWATNPVKKLPTSGNTSTLYTSAYIALSGPCNNSAQCVNATANWSYDDLVPTDLGLGVSRAYGRKVGIFYNYCAATAGTYCYASGRSGTNPTEDICPKGWHIPSSPTIIALNDYYSSDPYTFQEDISIPLAGYLSTSLSSIVFSQGNDGSIWSSTMFGNGNNVYGLGFNPSATNFVKPQNGSARNSFISVRCIFEP